MADQAMNEESLLQRWGISRLALEKLIARGLLSVTEQNGKLTFREDQVQALEEGGGGEDFVSLDEAMLELHASKEDLDNMVTAGQLPRYNFGGEPKFHMADLKAVAGMTGLSGDETAEITSAQTLAADAGAKLDLGKASAGEEAEEGDLFDFSEDLEGALGTTPAQKTQKPKEEFPETDMITEIVDVSGAESGEEDILGDIIEDVGAEVDLTAATDEELTAAPGGDETLDAETSHEATAEITELEEEALGDMEPGEEVTAEITQLEEETFEGEELENILAGEEEIAGAEGEEDEFEVPYGAPVAAGPEALIPSWVVVLMALILIVQIIAGLFVVETAISPKYSTSATKFLNLWKSE